MTSDVTTERATSALSEASSTSSHADAVLRTNLRQVLGTVLSLSSSSICYRRKLEAKRATTRRTGPADLAGV